MNQALNKLIEAVEKRVRLPKNASNARIDKAYAAQTEASALCMKLEEDLEARIEDLWTENKRMAESLSASYKRENGLKEAIR